MADWRANPVFRSAEAPGVSVQIGPSFEAPAGRLRMRRLCNRYGRLRSPRAPAGRLRMRMLCNRYGRLRSPRAPAGRLGMRRLCNRYGRLRSPRAPAGRLRMRRLRNSKQGQASHDKPNQDQIRPNNAKQDQISPNSKEVESGLFKGLQRPWTHFRAPSLFPSRWRRRSGSAWREACVSGPRHRRGRASAIAVCRAGRSP